MEVSSRHAGSSRPARALAAAAVIAASPWLASGRGAAQDAAHEIDRPRIAIAIDPSCREIDGAVVRLVLDVELGPDADLDASPERASTLVRASCEAQRVALELDETITGKRLARTIDVADTPLDGRSRLVGLAMAELISASWIELGMRRDPAVEVVGATAGEETRAIALDIARARMPASDPDDEEPRAPATAPRPGPIGVRAVGVGRLGGEPMHLAGGGGIAADWAFFEPLAIIVDLRAEHGSVGAGDLGSVALTAAWAGALLAVRLPLGRSYADFGVGGRAGVGWLEGSGAPGIEGARVTGALGAVCTATHLSMHVGQALHLHVGVELGWITLPVYGTLGRTGEVVTRLGDAYMAITLGLEIRPG